MNAATRSVGTYVYLFTNNTQLKAGVLSTPHRGRYVHGRCAHVRVAGPGTRGAHIRRYSRACARSLAHRHPLVSCRFDSRCRRVGCAMNSGAALQRGWEGLIVRVSATRTPCTPIAGMLGSPRAGMWTGPALCKRRTVQRWPVAASEDTGAKYSGGALWWGRWPGGGTPAHEGRRRAKGPCGRVRQAARLFGRPAPIGRCVTP